MDEHGVSPPAQGGCEEAPDEPPTENEHVATGHALGAAEDAGEGLRVGSSRRFDAVGKLDPAPTGNNPLREPTRLDSRGTKVLAGRLVTGKAALALAARKVMDERDLPSIGELCDNLVTEDGTGGAADLLDIASAEAAREHS